MIDYICGVLAVKEIGHVTIEANGVGYAVSIPLSTYDQLPLPGAETRLHIHYHVREDAHKLFGFFTSEERMLFRQLIGISKIGPKVALGVLSGVSVHDLIQSVNSGDPSRLRKIPGVGTKTAERLVMELKGKLGTSIATGTFVVSASRQSSVGAVTAALPVRDEAYAAMLSLGYNEKQVVKALERVGESGVGSDEPVETWIRKALQVI
jgi:Holliday junction DNA helicase RuvA